jgi:hypothetical protein
VQHAMPERNNGVAADNRIELRIGINLGDVIVEGDDLYGDGVNISARCPTPVTFVNGRDGDICIWWTHDGNARALPTYYLENSTPYPAHLRAS